MTEVPAELGETDVPTPCLLPGCFALCPPAVGRGRPRVYCTDEHRRAADVLKKQTIARLRRLRNQVRRDEHLLAALSGDGDARHVTAGLAYLLTPPIFFADASTTEAPGQ